MTIGKDMGGVGGKLSNTVTVNVIYYNPMEISMKNPQKTKNTNIIDQAPWYIHKHYSDRYIPLFIMVQFIQAKLQNSLDTHQQINGYLKYGTHIQVEYYLNIKNKIM